MASDLPASFIQTVAEHNVKITNLENLSKDSNDKLGKLLTEVQNLQITLAKTSCPNPGACNTLLPRITDLEVVTKDLVASKNRIAGALTLGSIFGTVLGVLGTWVVELMRVKH